MKKGILASVLTVTMVANVLVGLVGVPVAHASTTSYVQAGKTYSVGDTVYFGNYWQNDTNGSGKADQNDAKEPIEWQVLSQNGDDLFLMATKGLDCQPYNETYTDVTWETCTLRTWLNDDFYNNAFSASEQNAIKTTTLENEDNLYYGTEGGANTSDKIFLLSYSDATNTSYGFSSSYSTYDTKRQIKATEYAVDNGAYVSTSDGYAGKCWWWLRSPGYNSGYATDVYSDGYVDTYGFNVDDTSSAVCPALHLNLKSINQTPEASNSASPTATPTPLVTPSVSQTVKPNPTSTATPRPTSTVTVVPTPTKVATPTVIPASSPTAEATQPPTTGDYQYNIKNDGTIEITKYTGSEDVIQIPDEIDGRKVTSIGDRAFADNKKLFNVFLPEKMESIGPHAFDSCLSLVNVGFNESLKEINAYAFYNCPALKFIVLPEGVNKIGEKAFGYDNNDKLIPGFSLTGLSGTVAETYAKQNGMEFTNIGGDNSQIKKVTIKFTKKSVKVKRGKKATLKVKLTGAKKAKFLVDKKGKKVVKLSKKKARSVVVTGKKKGKAVITAKVASKKAKCKVTVK